ncbi:MAG: glycosyltransferase family 2 protein [Bacteroidota bacterium]
MKVSIITATYNSSETISDCLKSLNVQNYKDIEHLVIDGASRDETLNLVDSMKERKTKIISEPDEGIYHAMNKGIVLSSGDIIGFLHSDDFFKEDDVLQKITDRFLKGSPDIVYGDLFYVSKNNPEKVIRKWKSGEFNPKSLKYGWMPPHPAVFMKKEVYKEYGNFDLKYKISSDYEHMVRIFKNRDLKISYLPEVITCMKIGGASNRNLQNIINKIKEDYDIIKRYNLAGPLTLSMKNLRKLNQFF